MVLVTRKYGVSTKVILKYLLFWCVPAWWLPSIVDAAVALEAEILTDRHLAPVPGVARRAFALQLVLHPKAMDAEQTHFRRHTKRVVDPRLWQVPERITHGDTLGLILNEVVSNNAERIILEYRRYICRRFYGQGSILRQLPNLFETQIQPEHAVFGHCQRLRPVFRSNI